VVNYAGLSGDFNPIHVDHEFAKTTPFRKPIAHGLLVFAIGSGLGVHAPAIRTLAFVHVREWKFVGPVFICHTVRIIAKILDTSPGGRGKRGEVVWKRTIVNQDNKVVQEGVLVTLVEARPRPNGAADKPDASA